MSSQGSSEHDDLSCVLNQHYEVKVRPCIDLVDHLRTLGVEKDINLPAIAVIGDQSSGKSSVLEALSGVALPRGTGIVTRCPLVLKLKKVRKEEGWHGVLSFQDKRKKLINPAEIEKAVLVAQTALAGQGEGISHEMITLEIQSSDVPNLTLIDLPGIARVATGNQPKDIEQQIKDLIEKFIKKQETISLVVVPANIDIATTEALKMASSVDPDGHKTLGILTKPDLVDKGMEETVVRTVNNLVIELKKGYMIVKCRGQQDINDKLTLDKALEKEREFFSEHPHFRSLLEDGKATIPILSEILTKELVEHITNSLPQLSQKLGKKLEKTKEDLKVLGDGVPLDPDERDSYFITIIQQYNNVLQGVKRAEDEVKESDTKVYSKIRMEFKTWKCQMEAKFTNAFLAGNILSDAVVKDIRAHRGKELPGVVDNTTFESLVRKYIDELEKPALKLLKDVRDIIHSCVNTIVNEHFGGFPLLLRAAEDSFKECLETEFLKTEEHVKNQFIFEKTIFCQDSLYIEQLEIVKKKPHLQQITDVSEMAKHLSAYFKITTDRLANQVPLIIQYHMLDQYISHLQTAMNLIMKKSDAEDLLKEDAKVARKRTVLNERLNRLMNAGQLLSQFLHSVY